MSSNVLDRLHACIDYYARDILKNIGTDTLVGVLSENALHLHNSRTDSTRFITLASAIEKDFIFSKERFEKDLEIKKLPISFDFSYSGEHRVEASYNGFSRIICIPKALYLASLSPKLPKYEELVTNCLRSSPDPIDAVYIRILQAVLAGYVKLPNQKRRISSSTKRFKCMCNTCSHKWLSRPARKAPTTCPNCRTNVCISAPSDVTVSWWL